MFGLGVVLIGFQVEGMRKEFEKEISRLQVSIDSMFKLLKEQNTEVNSLAKELGYEWTSEAVKEMGGNDYGWDKSYTVWTPPKQVAVLKWRWKKIEKPSIKIHNVKGLKKHLKQIRSYKFNSKSK